MDTLFDLDEPVAFDRERLRDRLEALAARGVRIGGSSWRYEGWLGQIYSRSRYQVRGHFSKKLFEETCIAEYATVFPTVCGDFAFYQFPTEDYWRRLFEGTPPSLTIGLKVPEAITVAVDRDAAYRARDVETDLTGSRFTVEGPEGVIALRSFAYFFCNLAISDGRFDQLAGNL